MVSEIGPRCGTGKQAAAVVVAVADCTNNVDNE
jgi:hypothetical protein